MYWEDPLRDTFDIRVISCTPEGENFHVEIDSPVARPEGGGQAGDRGLLVLSDAEVRVVDTVEREGRVILVTKTEVAPGASAKLLIDMEWRRGMMRNHSAEHLFVASMKRVRDVELGYIWISGERGTVDLHGKDITLDEIARGEREVQRLILQDLPMHSRMVPVDQLSEEVRAREGVTRRHGEVRVVSFGDFDSSACSGTHVLSTGYIGCFKVVDCKHFPDRVRVEFLTHERALGLLSDVFNVVLSRKDSYPFEIEQLGPVLDRAKRLIQQREELVHVLEEIITTQAPSERVGDVSLVALYLPGMEPGDLRRLVKRMRFDGKMAVLLFAPGKKSNLIFAINDLPAEAREYIQPLVEQNGGRGGGSREVFTGGFARLEDPRAVFNRIADGLRERLRSG